MIQLERGQDQLGSSEAMAFSLDAEHSHMVRLAL